MKIRLEKKNRKTFANRKRKTVSASECVSNGGAANYANYFVTFVMSRTCACVMRTYVACPFSLFFLAQFFQKIANNTTWHSVYVSHCHTLYPFAWIFACGGKRFAIWRWNLKTGWNGDKTKVVTKSKVGSRCNPQNMTSLVCYCTECTLAIDLYLCIHEHVP